MSERYIKVFSGDENLYLDGAPIVIRASALLKDTVTGKMIGQLKFKNLSGKKINYLKVRILQFDALKNPIGDTISFEYLDIFVSDKEEFGSKKPIYLSNPSIRSFNIYGCDVAFEDGTVWTCDDSSWVPASNDSRIVKEIEADETYKKAIELYKTNNIEKLQYAITLFEKIQNLKDVFYEIEACTKKINEIKEFKSNTIISKIANKKVSLLIGISLVVILLSWIIFSFSAASKANELSIEILSRTPYYDSYLEMSNEYKYYEQYTMRNIYFALVQLIISAVVVALHFKKDSYTTTVTISRITLSALNFAIAVLTLAVCQHPNPFYGGIAFYFNSVLVFHIINCAFSMLLLCLILYTSKNKASPKKF